MFNVFWGPSQTAEADPRGGYKGRETGFKLLNTLKVINAKGNAETKPN